MGFKFKCDRFPIHSPNYYLDRVIELEETTAGPLYSIACKELNINLTGGNRQNTLNRLYNILASLPISTPIYEEDVGTTYEVVKSTKT